MKKNSNNRVQSKRKDDIFCSKYKKLQNSTKDSNSNSKPKENNPIRILQYIGSLEAGGSQSMIMNIYRNIDRNEIQFDFVIDRHEKNDLFYKDEIESLGGKVYIFQNHFKGYNYHSFTKQWTNFFQNHPEYTIIHCHVRSVASIVLKIAKKHNLKTICHSHSTSNGHGIKAIGKKLLQNRIPKYSDYMLACSENAARWLYGKENVKSGGCTIISNAIDPERYKFNLKSRKDIRNRHHIPDTDILIGHIGRFVDVKNHMFILQLADSLKDRNIKFILCGDGKLKTHIKKICANKNNVLFFDDATNAHKLYSAIDAFILPSKYEGVSLASIEAQFNGLTCLVSDQVPKEMVVSKKVDFLPLEEQIWTSRIQNIIPADIRNSELLPNASKYVVMNNVDKLSELYKRIPTGGANA